MSETHESGSPAAAADHWTSKITDAEVRGHLENKSWNKLDPIQAVEQAVRAHRGAEKMLGTPADQLVRLPRQDDEAGIRQFWQRLGAPQRPEEYDLPEFSDPEATARFQTAVRQAAVELNMPKSMAERMARQFHKFVADSGSAQQAEHSAQIRAEQQRLEYDWGRKGDAGWNANMFVADRAAERLGVPPEAMQRLKEGLGAAETAKLFVKIGRSMGEDRYVTGANPTANGIMSREQAAARRSELMNDRDWADRYLKGGAPEKREMLALNTLITEGPR